MGDGMLEQEKEPTDELLLRELLEAMETEIAEFRRLKEGALGASENSAEPKEDPARNLSTTSD